MQQQHWNQLRLDGWLGTLNSRRLFYIDTLLLPVASKWLIQRVCAAAPALTGVAPMPAASTTCSGIMLSPPPLGACGRPVRDSSWLELDICRDFQKEGSCSRNDQCRFAHPEPNVVNRDGKVTCCYDFLKVSVPHSFCSNRDQDMQCG